MTKRRAANRGGWRRTLCLALGMALVLTATVSFAESDPTSVVASTPEPVSGETATEVWSDVDLQDPWMFEMEAHAPEDPAGPEAQSGLGPLEQIFQRIGGLLSPLLDQLGIRVGAVEPNMQPPEPAAPTAAEIALYENAEVRKFMEIYLDSHRDEFGRGLARAGRYIPMIQRIFAEEGMPQDLAYLTIIESNLNPRALSPKRAAGLWQFMRATANSFGLRVEPWYDERLDPVLSTRAAARLLRYLHDRFGNWELALAAYNAGEGRVVRAMRASRAEGETADFWNLSLPRETRRYLPSFMAVALIYNDLEGFGFEPLQPGAYLDYEVVRDKFHTTLAEIADRIGYSEDLLRELNPAWKQGLIPPAHRGTVLLRLPPGGTTRLRQAMASGPLAPPALVRHTVARGETLSGIANRYGLPMHVLLSVNAISNRNLVRRGQVLLVPLSSSRPAPPEAREI